MYSTKKRNPIAEAMIEMLATGLKRKSITSPSKWAETYREMQSGTWTFKYHPWLREMHDSKADFNVGQKAAQMGFTEAMLNIVFHGIDLLRRDCLYVLPNKNPDAGDFSSGRFAPALELSKHLTNLFSDADNVGHKRAGSANLYVCGSQSRSGLKSKPISILVMDEVAEFEQDNIPLALRRVDGQLEYLIWMISTPTLPGFGISKYYEQTDKRHFYFKCPGCSKHIELSFPDSIVIVGEDQHDPRIDESHYICTDCKKVLDHAAKPEFLASGIWVPTVGNRTKAGWTIPQLYSSAKVGRASNFAKMYFESKTDPATEVELYNSALGLPHVTKGARVDDEHLDHCIMHGPKYRNNDPPRRGLVTMGVDVGKFLHYEIALWKFDQQKYFGDISNASVPLILKQGKCEDISELEKLMQQYNVISCVVDAYPERRLVGSFAKKFLGRVRLCFFGRNIRGKTIQHSKTTEAGIEPMIIVDRSSWLDQSLGRFINGTISLPIDTDIEYRQQVKAPVKTYKKDADGNPMIIYLTEEGRGDHYAFARCYNEIALQFAAGIGGNEDIQ